MSGILFGLGVLLTAVGVGMIGFGIPVREFSFGNTMISAGTTALAGGFVVIGLAAAVRQLTRIAETLKARPAPRPSRTEASESAAVAVQPAAPAPAAQPAPAPRVAPVRAPMPPQPRSEPAVREPRAAEAAPDVSAEAIERLRASIIRPERASAEPTVVAVSEDVPLSPRVPARPAPQRAATVTAEPATNGSGQPGEATPVGQRKSGLDFLFRSRSAAKRTENFETVWPAETRAAPKAGKPAPQPPAPPPAAAPVSPPPPLAAAPATAPSTDTEAQPVAILKSGVVDGMAYTLYADGSIEATLPQGTVRFGSIAELRSHIEANS
jgi:hypothetical protein